MAVTSAPVSASVAARAPNPRRPRQRAAAVAPSVNTPRSIPVHTSLGSCVGATARPDANRPYTSAEASVATKAVNATTATTAIRMRVLVGIVGALVSAILARTRAWSASEGLTPRASCSSRSARSINISDPAAVGQCGLDLPVRPVRALSHAVNGGAEHRSCIRRAQTFVAHEQVGRSVLFRHLAQLGDHHIEQVVRGQFRFRCALGIDVNVLELRNVMGRAEPFRSPLPVAYSAQVKRTRNGVAPVQHV